jgi:molybdopterin-containing oxidoreductase family iron-sulfur binding subunit
MASKTTLPDTQQHPTHPAPAESLPAPPSLERRSFLKLAATGAALVAGGQAAAMLGLLERVSAAEIEAAGSRAAHQWAFIIDLRRCDGCRECTTACQDEHYLPPEQEWIRVYQLTDASGGDYFLPVLCQMCERPPCVQVCPVTATYRTDDGPIAIDQSVCIGCRMCMAACPYGVRFFNWDPPVEVPPEARHDGPELQVPQVQGTVGKCDSCAHLTREGELPACVRSCGMEAVYVADFVTNVATNGRESVGLSQYLREHDVYRLKEHLGTETRVYYVAGHGQDLDY